MFTRVLALLPFVLLVSASTIKARDNTCSTGDLNCCQMKTVQEATNDLTKQGVDVGSVNLPVNTIVGVGCTPITVIGGLNTGGSCTATTVCCEGNSYNGLFNLGCNAITL